MRYKAIFIDIDDTLLDYVPCCREAFNMALPEHPEHFDLFFAISGRLFSEAKHGLHTIAEVMDLYPQEFIAAIGYPEEAVEPFKQAFRAAWGTTHTLVPGAKEMLETLRAKGYRLFAASNVSVTCSAAALSTPASCRISRTRISPWTSVMTSPTSVFTRRPYAAPDCNRTKC